MVTRDAAAIAAPGAGQSAAGRWSRIVEFVDRLLGRLDRAVLAVASALFCALVGVVIAAVFFRYVLNSSLLWGEELARYLAMWLVFLGLSCAHRRNEHVSVGSVLRRAPLLGAAGARRIAEAVTVFFCAVVTLLGAELTVLNFERHQTSPALQIPIAWAYLAIPVGFLLMTLQALVRLVGPEPAVDGHEEVQP
ncbi:TRAP transporter small permease [Rhizomonospora bruguierae]|uniref:TRAP transporter small permease n=1 Tax=Rhizomonospora bruguierae TaxID=1581705 RepID=UPI001BCA991C|nr:TRAP transporter small permease [Micromonospora sp. NBRC 107566]